MYKQWFCLKITLSLALHPTEAKFPEITQKILLINDERDFLRANLDLDKKFMTTSSKKQRVWERERERARRRGRARGRCRSQLVAKEQRERGTESVTPVCLRTAANLYRPIRATILIRIWILWTLSWAFTDFPRVQDSDRFSLCLSHTHFPLQLWIPNKLFEGNETNCWCTHYIRLQDTWTPLWGGQTCIDVRTHHPLDNLGYFFVILILKEQRFV